MSKAQFKLASDYAPTGDQPEAIEALVAGLTPGSGSRPWRA